MKINVVRDDALSKEYRMHISGADIKNHINILITEESPNISIEGFRKGKAPISLIKSRYGQRFEQKARMTVLENSINDLAKTYNLNKSDLHVDFDNNNKESPEDINLVITYDTTEDFELKELDTLKLDEYSLDVEDAGLKDFIYQRHFLHARTDFQNPTDEAITKNHCAEITMSVYFDDKQKMEVFANKTFVVYANNDAYLGKDFMKKLIGLKKGDNESFKMTFPKTQPSKELAGKEHKVTITVNNVFAMKTISEEEFITEQCKVFNAENAEEAKSKMIQSYTRNFAHEYIDPIHKRKVLDALDEAYKIDVSPHLLAKEREQIQKRFAQEKENAAKNDIILEEEMTKTPKEIEKELDKLALRRIKISSIFKKLGDKYPSELKITEWDMKMQLFEYAHARSLDFNAVLDLAEKNEEFRRMIINVVRENKTLNFVHKSATLTAKAVKEEIEILKVFNEILPGVLLSY